MDFCCNYGIYGDFDEVFELDQFKEMARTTVGGECFDSDIGQLDTLNNYYFPHAIFNCRRSEEDIVDDKTFCLLFYPKKNIKIYQQNCHHQSNTIIDSFQSTYRKCQNLASDNCKIFLILYGRKVNYDLLTAKTQPNTNLLEQEMFHQIFTQSSTTKTKKKKTTTNSNSSSRSQQIQVQNPTKPSTTYTDLLTGTSSTDLLTGSSKNCCSSANCNSSDFVVNEQSVKIFWTEFSLTYDINLIDSSDLENLFKWINCFIKSLLKTEKYTAEQINIRGNLASVGKHLPSIPIDTAESGQVEKCWIQQLMQIKDITEEMAKSIAQIFPTLYSLRSAFIQNGNDLQFLADTIVNKGGFGIMAKNQPMGLTISQRLYTILFSDNTEEFV